MYPAEVPEIPQYYEYIEVYFYCIDNLKYGLHISVLKLNLWVKANCLKLT